VAIKSLAQLALENQKRVDQSVDLARVAEKLTQAKKDENEALTRTVALTGDEAAARVAAKKAADNLAESNEALAKADRRVVESLQLAKDRLIEYAEAQGISAEQIKLSVDAYDKLIAARTADLEKSTQQAAASRAAAAQAELAAAAVKDNASQYEALAEAVKDAEIRLQDVIRAHVKDRATSEDVQKATENLAKAKGLLKDALDDQERALARVLNSMKADAELSKAQIELELTKLKIRRDELVARGQTALAALEENRIRQLELDLVRAGTNAKRAEAEEVLRATELRLKQLDAQNLLTPALKQELETTIKQQKAILLQTDAARANEEQTKKNNDAIRNGTVVRDENRRTTDNQTSSVQNNSNAVRTNTSEIESNTQAFNRWISSYVEGYKKRAALTGPGSAKSVLEWEGRNADGSINTSGPGTSGQGAYTTGQGYFTIDGRAVDERTYRNYLATKDLPSGGGPFGGPARNAPAPTPAPAPPAGGYQVTVVIGGVTTGIGAADKASADRLIKALEEAYRAGGGG
jgi:hypothetical protein